uniref:Inner membrane protein n=1 Tax=Mesocestoides corti TaxID=53468 RepID=A0A5K3EJ06_MESCO
MKKTRTTDNALLINNKPELNVIRVPHDVFDTHIHPLIRFCLWLAAYLSRMPLEHSDTEDWLRPPR